MAARSELQLINGISRRLRIDAPLRDVPGKYGEWNSIYRPLRQWSASGVWESVAIALQGRRSRAGTINSTAPLSIPPQFTPISRQLAEMGLVNELLAARGPSVKCLSHAKSRPIAVDLTPGEAQRY
jgi:transposase